MDFLSIDVGGSSIKHAVIDDKGNIKAKGKFTTPRTWEDFIAKLVAVKADYASSYQLIGVGGSFPGAVDDTAGVIGGSSAIAYLHDFPIRKQLEKALDLPVSLENDANCAALGEAWIGNGRDYADMMFLVIGSGVGGAVVKNKRIHHGKHFHGGEFGYMVVDNAGTILSEAASTRVLVEKVAAAKNLKVTDLDGEKVFALAEKGDIIAQENITALYQNLARAIYNLQYSFDPEIFVLGGAISARPDFAAKISQEIDQILAKVKIAKVKPIVVGSKYGNDANLLGAVYDFINKYPQ